MSIGSSVRFDKRYILALFALGIWVWMGYSIVSHTTSRIIKATIIQSKKAVRYLDDKLYPIKKEVLWFDTLTFPKGNELRHPKYGYLGYRQDFVIFFDMDVELSADRFVSFVVYSDDGFRLLIDGKKIMEYIYDRPFRKSQKIVHLSKGKHHIRIKYFQGYGQLGIVGYYGVGKSLEDAKRAKRLYLGRSSAELRFIEQ